MSNTDVTPEDRAMSLEGEHLRRAIDRKPWVIIGVMCAFGLRCEADSMGDPDTGTAPALSPLLNLRTAKPAGALESVNRPQKGRESKPKSAKTKPKRSQNRGKRSQTNPDEAKESQSHGLAGPPVFGRSGRRPARHRLGTRARLESQAAIAGRKARVLPCRECCVPHGSTQAAEALEGLPPQCRVRDHLQAGAALTKQRVSFRIAIEHAQAVAMAIDRAKSRALDDHDVIAAALRVDPSGPQFESGRGNAHTQG
jgi:hypothetical protein